MSKWNANKEGYTDNTASIAVKRAATKEREAIMAKKRNCRRTRKEEAVHEKAVKVRKMTDEQLVEYIENRVEKARSEGFNKAKKEASSAEANLVNIEKALEEIKQIRGIGLIKIGRIEEILERHLLGGEHA